MLRADVMEHYGLTKDFSRAGFFETAQHKTLFKQLQVSVHAGVLIALTGLVGSGKTTMLRRLQDKLAENAQIIISKSLALEKDKTTIATLISALFYDLSGDTNYKVPRQKEKRERELQELTRKKTIVLFCDEAHELRRPTLTGLKRLREVVGDGGGTLSIVLAGHPKLGNDLKGPHMEEIGYRTQVLSLDAMQGSLREYMHWLVKQCTDSKGKPPEIIKPEAIDHLAEKLKTPLQIEQHLRRALEEAFHTGGEPVDVEILQTTLSRRMDDLEPMLIRNGYSDKVIAEQLHLRKAEVHRFLQNSLEPARQQEIIEQLRDVGLPI